MCPVILSWVFGDRSVCGVVCGLLRTWVTSVIVTQCIHGYLINKNIYFLSSDQCHWFMKV